METIWHRLDPIRKGTQEIPGLPGVRLEAVPVFGDGRGTVLELFRTDEVPAGYKPLMACCSWSHPGVSRGPHQHVGQDDYFTFAGPSEFIVYLWDDRPGAEKAGQGWQIPTGQSNPTRVYVPRGVVHGYKNTGAVPGLVVTVTNLLYKGEGRKEAVDEIRHELDPKSPYRIPDA
jgi:dTDP-4-dehydrorhamnose 3,5-epimerase